MLCIASEKDHAEDLGMDGKIILEWGLRKWGGRVWTGCIWLRIGTSNGNEPSGSTKGRKFLD
jgi:hypothetical protein